ncbi:hypothetical protein PGB90_002898 [Kerria lacca]
MDFLELVQNLDLKLSQSINPKNKLDEATQNHNKAYIKSNQLQANFWQSIMPRPVDDFLLDNQSDINAEHDVEDKSVKYSKLRRKRGIEENVSFTDDSSSVINDENINLNSDVISNQNCSLTNDFQSEFSDFSSKLNASPKNNAKKKKGKSKDDDDGCSSEEERWLHAIESGKLEEVDDELKKIKPKDPKLMTARQRAMLERKSDKDGFSEQLLSLPTGYREKIITPEMLEEKAKKLQKRKQLADEKRENDKKKTMERLLKKSESKSIKISQRQKFFKKTVPYVVYTSNINLNTISMPLEFSFPLNSSPKIIKQTELCGRAGCGNIKRYSCSRSKIPSCSIECYKENLKNFIQIIPK